MDAYPGLSDWELAQGQISQTSYELTPSENGATVVLGICPCPLTFHETGVESLSSRASPSNCYRGQSLIFSRHPYAPTDENYVLFVEEAEEGVEFRRNLAFPSLSEFI